MPEVEEKEMVVIHTGEGHAWQWNPDKHEETHETMPDGNVITHVRPKEPQT